MSKYIIYGVFLLLISILIYNKIKGEKGTWDSKEDIQEYAALMGPIIQEDEYKDKKKKKKNNSYYSQVSNIYTKPVFDSYNKPKTIKGLNPQLRAIDVLSSAKIANIIKNNMKYRNFGESIGEIICRKYAEHIFKKPFNKARPDFLKNPVTSSNLELDCFCEDINLGIEYNGKQHYEYTPKFHNNKQDFYNQKYRDLIKKEACMKNGINLIEVPYTVNHDSIPLYIESALKKLGLV